jgi:hypothetical protein
MRRILLTTLSALLILTAAAATRYGNEWIDYSRIHYKIKVGADGIYRIPYSTLSATIPNLTSVSATSLVMYHNGVAVPIYVSSIGNNILSGDYIEFYGKKNIGDMDSVLYPQTGFQPHIYRSAYTDTSIYYLTTNSSTVNPRLVFIPNDTLGISTVTAESYFMHTSRAVFTNTFSNGQPFYLGGTYLYKSLFDLGEGWGSTWINYPNTFNISLPAPAVSTSGPVPRVKCNLFTRSYEGHQLEVAFNTTIVKTISFTGNGYNTLDTNLTLAALAATNTLSVAEKAAATSGNQNLAMYAELRYPRQYDFGGVPTFYWQCISGTGKRHFSITGITDGGTQPLIYDLTNGIIIRSTDAVGSTIKHFVFPSGLATRELYVRTDNATSMIEVASMDTLTFRDYRATAAQGNYLVLYSTRIATDTTGVNWVEQYRKYRDQIANPGIGRYDARSIDIEQLYDQFGYGIRKSPLGIRNFVEYAVDKWIKKPEYLFIIGKARLYNDMRASAAAYDMCVIPSFGAPGSDNLLSCRRGSNRPLLAVGRLAARSAYDTKNYLAKMKIYESYLGNTTWDKDNKLWMKQLLHFSGGETADEQTEFKGYLADWEAIASDTSWGASTRTFYKTSSIPIDISQAQIIKDKVDSGVSLLTFFGHSAGTAFDISIDNPENWNNYQKFPIIYSNGCFSGSLHDNNGGGVFGSFSERFVLTPAKGAIGFMATASTSVSSGLRTYGAFLYNNFCRTRYTRPWGKAMQQAQINQDSLYSNDDFSMMVAYEMTLHGDPAISLFQFAKPDYEIDAGSVYFSPSKIDAGTDTFTVNVITANLGKAVKDSIQVSITRSYTDPANPNNQITTVYKRKYFAPYYIDTLAFKIPTLVNLNQGYGLNQFAVLVESEGRINEMSEQNNGTNLAFSTIIESDDVIPVYPYTYSIVPTQSPILKASTTDPFAPSKTYRVQVDTSELFAQPMAATTITQTGGVIHWQLPIQMRDSTVYYWRVSRDSTSPTLNYNWHTSSFIYLKNEYPGWNQSHYYQYQKDRYNDNVYLGTDRVFKYKPTINTIHVTTGWCRDVGGLPTFSASNLEWNFNSVNQYRFRMGGCGYSTGTHKGGLTFAVIDTVTNYIWVSQNTGTNYGKYGNVHCASKTLDQPGFDFNIIGNHPTLGIPWSQVIMNFLDSIPTGHIVLMYSVNKPDWVNMDSILAQRLIAMGGTKLSLLKSGAVNAPYTFYALKGNPAIKQEAIGQDYTTVLDTNLTYSVLWYKGDMSSTIIGPAYDWGSVHWRSRAKELPTADIQSLDVYGIQQNTAEVFLKNIQMGDTSLSFVNATVYPYIRLVLHTQDDTVHTPTQLDYWRVLYKAIPEAAINPNAYFKVQRDTIGLGDTLSIGIALENVSNVAMDSIRTSYTIKNTKTNTVVSYSIVQDSIHAFDTLILSSKNKCSIPIYWG